MEDRLLFRHSSKQGKTITEWNNGKFEKYQGDARIWTGGPGRQVLISPISIGSAEESTQTLSVGLTKDQIKDSPPLESDEPVSRQYEVIFNQYHAWGNYWEGPLTWGNRPYPRLLQREEAKVATVESDNHLRSTHEILSYSIEARAGRGWEKFKKYFFYN